MMLSHSMLAVGAVFLLGIAADVAWCVYRGRKASAAETDAASAEETDAASAEARPRSNELARLAFALLGRAGGTIAGESYVVGCSPPPENSEWYLWRYDPTDAGQCRQVVGLIARAAEDPELSLSRDQSRGLIDLVLRSHVEAGNSVKG